jgi:hypothetical protein
MTRSLLYRRQSLVAGRDHQKSLRVVSTLLMFEVWENHLLLKISGMALGLHSEAAITDPLLEMLQMIASMPDALLRPV